MKGKGGLQTQEAGFRNLFNSYTILEEKRSGVSRDSYRDEMVIQKISDEMTELKVDNDDKYRDSHRGNGTCSGEMGEMALKKILRIYRN